MDRTLLATGLALAALIAPAAAGAAPPKVAPGSAKPQHIGTSRGPAVADGARYVALRPRAGRLVIVDARRGRARTRRVARTCVQHDVALRRVLLSCTRGHHPALLSIRSGRVRRVPRESPPLGARYFQLGRHWIFGWGCHRTCFTAVLNWRTGEARAGCVPVEDPCDLDRPEPSPLRPCGTRMRTLAYRHPYAVRFLGAGSRPTLAVTRCGRRTVRLSRCFRDCVFVRVSSRMLTWAEGPVVHAYDLRTGRRRWWVFERRGRAAHRHVAVAHTRGSLFVSVPTRPEPSRQGAHRVYRIDRPFRG